MVVTTYLKEPLQCHNHWLRLARQRYLTGGRGRSEQGLRLREQAGRLNAVAPHRRGPTSGSPSRTDRDSPEGADPVGTHLRKVRQSQGEGTG